MQTSRQPSAQEYAGSDSDDELAALQQRALLQLSAADGGGQGRHALALYDDLSLSLSLLVTLFTYFSCLRFD